MSDYHEMYGEWTDMMGYDPAYVGEEQDDEHTNNPVGQDDWAHNNDDLEGGF